MTNLAWQNKYQGGFCYAACQDLFSWYNPSIYHCRKGCDFAVGRGDDAKEREQAEKMCKRWTAESMHTYKGELDSIEELRVHADMFPNKPKNIYKACLAGIRRQKY